LNGFSNCRSILTVDGLTASTIRICPLPAFLLPDQA
jgi:hypothetical protein